MAQKIYTPSTGADSWKCLLADPRHWKTGHSAKTLAHCWEEAKEGFPESFASALRASGLNMELLLAMPEFKVDLPPSGRPSQNDIFVLARESTNITVIMVEGKVNELFDKTVGDWKNSNGKEERLRFLLEKLELTRLGTIDDIRYQLLHRTVSAILTAEQFYAKRAMMIVHSFGDKDTPNWNDFKMFAALLADEEPQPDRVYRCKTLSSSIELWIGWVSGEKKYLKA